MFLQEFKALARLSLPLAIVQAGYHFVGFVDTVMAGQTNKTTLGAVGLGAVIFFAVSVTGMGLVLGIDPIITQAIGARDATLARKTMWQGVYVAGLALVPLIAIIAGIGFSLELVGVNHELATETRAYLLGRAPAIMFVASAALRSYLQAYAVTRPIVFAVVVTNVFNFIADYVFLFGAAGLERIGLPGFGLPGLGAFGLGLASSVATLAQVAVMIAAVKIMPLANGEAYYRRVDRNLIKKIVSLGLPIAGHYGVEVGFFAFVGLLMGRLGTEAMAAHQVALSVASVTFAVCMGIGSATVVRVGHAVGRGDSMGARHAGLSGMLLGLGFMSFCSLGLGLFPGVIARFMTSDPKVIPVAVSLLVIAAGFQLFDGLQAIAAGALRGVGATQFAFWGNVAGHWFFGAPAAIVLAFYFGLGASGLWWGFTLGLFMVALLLASRFIWVSHRPMAKVF